MKIELTANGAVLLYDGTVVTRLGRLDAAGSSFGLLPELSEETTSLAGADGELLKSVRFAARAMSLSVWTDDGLSADEKRAAADAAARVAGVSREESLIFYDSYHFNPPRVRNVRFAGGADDPINHADWEEITIPLKAYDPFWYETEVQHCAGGAFTVKGNVSFYASLYAPAGSCAPSLSVDGAAACSYGGNVESGAVLRVDTDAQTALVQFAGDTNVDRTEQWNGQEIRLSPGEHSVACTGGAVLEWRGRWA